MRPAMHLYITHALYFEIYTLPLEGIQLADVHRRICSVGLCVLLHVKPFIWLPWDVSSRPYVCTSTTLPFEDYSSPRPSISSIREDTSIKSVVENREI